MHSHIHPCMHTPKHLHMHIVHSLYIYVHITGVVPRVSKVKVKGRIDDKETLQLSVANHLYIIQSNF